MSAVPSPKPVRWRLAVLAIQVLLGLPALAWSALLIVVGSTDIRVVPLSITLAIAWAGYAQCCWRWLHDQPVQGRWLLAGVLGYLGLWLYWHVYWRMVSDEVGQVASALAFMTLMALPLLLSIPLFGWSWWNARAAGVPDGDPPSQSEPPQPNTPV